VASIYDEGGDLKKAMFHYKEAAMAGHEMAQLNLGCIEFEFGNKEQAAKHWKIAASAGHYKAMHNLRLLFDQGVVCRESIDSTLISYNNSCADMRSKAREAFISEMI
jgi:TPR repeat protein